MRCPPSSRLGLVVALLASMAAVLAGAVAPAATPADPRLAAFVAAGGTLADICGEHGTAPGDRHCDACRLLGPAVVPEPAGATAVWRVTEGGPAPTVAIGVHAAAAAGVRPRGPPGGA